MKQSLIYIEHILDCIQKIKKYTSNSSKEDFLNSPIMQDAVIRNLEVIGEATKKIDKSFRERHADIEWKKIAGMRDKLIHDYIGVDIWAVWNVVDKILPDFEMEIKAIIEKESNHK